MLMASRQTRRGGGDTYERRQASVVGKAAKAEMTPRRGESPAVGKGRASVVIDRGERGMSISASKKREAGKSPSFLKKPRL